jgi:hypothetical protein
MIGAIAGDIIGSVYEHDGIKTKDFPLFHPECEFTDNTVLTVAIAHSIDSSLDPELHPLQQLPLRRFDIDDPATARILWKGLLA